MKLQKVAAPNLPLASASWTQRFQEQFSNVLRLFFNRVVGTLNELLGEDGGRYISSPHTAVYDTTVQTAALANTGYPVTFNSTYLTNSVYRGNADTSRIYVTHAGIYNFAFSLQVDQASANTHTLWVWFRRNGVDAPYSASEYAVSGSDAQTIAALNYFVEMDAGDYFQLIWAVSNTAVYIATISTPAGIPESPSAILTVNFVSESSRVTEVAP